MVGSQVGGTYIIFLFVHDVIIQTYLTPILYSRGLFYIFVNHCINCVYLYMYIQLYRRYYNNIEIYFSGKQKRTRKTNKRHSDRNQLQTMHRGKGMSFDVPIYSFFTGNIVIFIVSFVIKPVVGNVQKRANTIVQIATARRYRLRV